MRRHRIRRHDTSLQTALGGVASRGAPIGVLGEGALPARLGWPSASLRSPLSSVCRRFYAFRRMGFPPSLSAAGPASCLSALRTRSEETPSKMLPTKARAAGVAREGGSSWPQGQVLPPAGRRWFVRTCCAPGRVCLVKPESVRVAPRNITQSMTERL